MLDTTSNILGCTAFNHVRFLIRFWWWWWWYQNLIPKLMRFSQACGQWSRVWFHRIIVILIPHLNLICKSHMLETGLFLRALCQDIKCKRVIFNLFFFVFLFLCSEYMPIYCISLFWYFISCNVVVKLRTQRMF